MASATASIAAISSEKLTGLARCFLVSGSRRWTAVRRVQRRDGMVLLVRKTVRIEEP